MATGSDLVRRARRYRGTPFAAGGRNAYGLDCGGLILRVAADLDLAVPAVPNYHIAFDSGCVTGFLEPFCERIDLAAGLDLYQGKGILPGDFLVFSLAKGVQHLGIATGEGTFVHSWDTPSVREVVEIPLDDWWQDRLLSIWRAWELEGTP
jgi:cell wall-associated NlpC family hydrolase